MTTANADRRKTVAGRIRLNAVWCVTGSTWFGLQLGVAMWRPHDPFYPFPLIFWGLFTVLYARGVIIQLSQLSYAVPLADADEKRKEGRRLMAYVLGIAFASFCFALCVVAAKSLGRLYAFAAVALGAFTILMIFITERRIKHIARNFYHPPDASLT
jgi:hypothetical protein